MYGQYIVQTFSILIIRLVLEDSNICLLVFITRLFKRTLYSEKDMDSFNAEYFQKPNSE